MKTTIRTTIRTTTTRALALLSVGLLAAAGAYAQAGVIRQLSGTVELRHPGAADFVAASVGDQVGEDTVIFTALRSTALVEVGSTTITVRPLTRLTLTEISAGAGAETLSASLQTGRVRVDVNPPTGARASMSITSPSATASVRGTSFSFDGRSLSVGEGIVGFRGRRGVMAPVQAGFVTTVARDGRAAPSVYVGTGRQGEVGAVASAADPVAPQGPPGLDTRHRGLGEVGGVGGASLDVRIDLDF